MCAKKVLFSLTNTVSSFLIITFLLQLSDLPSLSFQLCTTNAALHYDCTVPRLMAHLGKAIITKLIYSLTQEVCHHIQYL